MCEIDDRGSCENFQKIQKKEEIFTQILKEREREREFQLRED